jgi:hypothetical protein
MAGGHPLTQHTTDPAPTSVIDVGSPSDVRRVWRTMLAIVAPVPWLALAISNGITPDELGGTTEETFHAITADPSAARAAHWLGLAFALLLVPSAVAMIVAHRRVMPRLTLIVGGFVAYACCSTLINPNLNLIALITAEHGLDSGTTIDLATRLEEYPTTIVAILPFFLTITLGRIALGVLLWKARTAPRPLAIAMLLASPVEFLLAGGPFGSNFGPAVSYVLTSIGFAAASVALWRMSDDEFDLAPTGVSAVHTS